MAPFLTLYCSKAPGLPLHANKVLLGVAILLDNCLAQVHSKVTVPQSPPCVTVALLPDCNDSDCFIYDKNKQRCSAGDNSSQGSHPNSSMGESWSGLHLCSVQLLQRPSCMQTPSHVPDNTIYACGLINLKHSSTRLQNCPH